MSKYVLWWGLQNWHWKNTIHTRESDSKINLSYRSGVGTLALFIKFKKILLWVFFFFGAYYLLQVHSSRNSSQERISRCEVKNCSWRAKEQIWVKIYTVNRNEKRLYADVCTYYIVFGYSTPTLPKKVRILMCACTLVPVCNNSSLILFWFIMNWYILLVTFIWWKTHQLIGWINISFALFL